jgi:hypothetical protein
LVRAAEIALWIVSSSRVSEAVDGVVVTDGLAFGSGGNASDVSTYEIFRGGCCFQGELRVVLTVVVVALETDIDEESMAANFVVSLLYLRGRTYGE